MSSVHTTTPGKKLIKKCEISSNMPVSKSNRYNHRIACRTRTIDDSIFNIVNEERSIENNILNMGFKENNTPSTKSSRSVRIKTKPTVLNACYTPSSLYKNMHTTPGSNQKSKSKICANKAGTNKNKISTLSLARDSDEESTEMSNLSVAVRVRPLNSQECSKVNVKNVVQTSKNEITILGGTSADASAGVTHSFVYDHVFDSSDPELEFFANQNKVFERTAKPLIDRAFEGYNACLFAYGQTGSGKSYSMMGIENTDINDINEEAGIIPRFCYELFRRIDEKKDLIQAEIEISYFEIYNEKIHDLLSVAHVIESNSNTIACVGYSTPNAHYQQSRPTLKVREHPIWGPYIVDLSIHSVDSYESLRNWLAVGNSQRATAATGLNHNSSRSHSILNIVLNIIDISEKSPRSYTDQKNAAIDMRQTRRSKISLVDLAGSERINYSKNNCERIREGVSINKSLLTLGKVIASLSESKKNNCAVFVPYRESVLTWLLRENLGGNSRTVMLATISPANLHLDETLATLRYASKARSIVNRIKVNESPHDRVIRELKAEIDRLKSLRNEYERQKRLSSGTTTIPRKIIIETSVDESEVEALRQQLNERERELYHAEKSWMQRLKEAEDQRKSEMLLLKRKGLALEMSTQENQACLVNLAADPILSGTLFYILPPGIVKIGRTRTSSYCSQPDIILDGPLVGYHHCTIENKDGELFITPDNDDFETYLNGELVHDRTQIFSGDRLVIGGSHYFRISNPFCTMKRRKNDKLVDYQLAHQEILHKQEEKLRRQLEEEKRAALSCIELERLENERTFKERMKILELEKFTVKCNREILEEEQKAFKNEESKTEKQTNDTDTVIYKSTLLEDIEKIMQNPSYENLHKTQLLIKEATQRCRNFGINIEFHHSQELDEFGCFRTVVMIIDKERSLKAEWPLARLTVWLDIIRENENLNLDNIFNSVDIEWQSDSNLNDTFNDSMNSSRISLNFNTVKDFVLRRQPLKTLSKLLSPQKNKMINQCAQNSNSQKKSQLQKFSLNQFNTKRTLTYDEDQCEQSKVCSSSSTNDDHNFINLAKSYIQDIERKTILLKNLCNQQIKESEKPPRTDSEIQIHAGIVKLENIVEEMLSCFVFHLVDQS